VLKALYVYIGRVLDARTIATHRLEKGAGRVEVAGLVLKEPYQLYITMEGCVERRAIAKYLYEVVQPEEDFFESFVDSFEWVVETCMNFFFSADVRKAHMKERQTALVSTSAASSNGGSEIKGGGGSDVSRRGQVKHAFTMSYMSQHAKGNLLRYYGLNEITEVNCAQEGQFALQVKEGAQLPVGGRLGLDQISPYQDALGMRQVCCVPALLLGEMMCGWVGCRR
jgi:hypothetical protein